MAKIAVDVVILLPEEIMDLVIGLNQKFESVSRLNKKTNLPHITLAMGVIDDSEIPLVNDKLKNICKDMGPLDMELTEVYHITTDDGKKSFSFRVKKTDQLKNLHKLIMAEFKSIFTYDVDASMFTQEEKIDSSSMYWVETFAKRHAGSDNYNPHISLKCKNDVVFNDIPISFKGSTVALCHMGAHGTCRKILGKIFLQ